MNTMQKIIKYFAIAFAVFLIVAIFTGIYNIGGMVLGNIVNYGSDGLNIDKYDDDANILSIDIATTDLIIKSGKDLKVDVKNNKYIKINRKNNKLAITEKSHSIKIKNKSSITIYIPEDIVFEEVHIGAGVGKVTIDKLDAKNLNLEVGTGKVIMKNINVLSKTIIEGGIGKVLIEESSFKNLKLEVGIGEFNISSMLKGKSEIEAGIGELNIELLDSKDNYTIETETGIGSIKIDGKKVQNDYKYGQGQNKINLEGGIGSINITFKK